MAEIFKHPEQNGNEGSWQEATGASEDAKSAQETLFNSLVDLQKTRGKFSKIQSEYLYDINNGRLEDAKKLFLKYKLDINNNAAGTTFLHMAVSNGDTKNIMFAASQNADASKKDALERTPYDIAKMNGDESLMRILEIWRTVQEQGQKIDFAQLQRNTMLNENFSSTVRFLANVAKNASAYIYSLPSKTKKMAATMIVALMIPLSITYGIHEHRLSSGYIQNSKEIADATNWLNTHGNPCIFHAELFQRGGRLYYYLFNTKAQRDFFERNKKLYDNISLIPQNDPWKNKGNRVYDKVYVEFTLNGNRYLLDPSYLADGGTEIKKVFQALGVSNKELTKSEATKMMNTDVGRLAFNILLKVN